MAQQPQQGCQIDRSTKIGAGAVAVVTPAMGINWATGVTLTRYFPSYYTGSSVAGLQTFYNYRDTWVETEMLPAVGTKPYVMYWLGWPMSPGCSLGGAGNSECGFVVGSSNNSLGIMINMGRTRGIGNAYTSVDNWGGCNNKWTTNYTAGETLAFGSSGPPVMLMMVRRTSGQLEFWRDGLLINTVAMATTNVLAFKMEVGTWIASQNWVSNSHTALAGLSILNSDPTNAELTTFGRNPWMMFKAPANLLSQVLPLMGAGATPRRALIMVNGQITQVVDALVGTNQKPLVLYLGAVRQRVASEGVPLILVNGTIRTLAANERLVV